jgi:hypothetical protein
MKLPWQRRVKAVHQYSRESVTAIPRIRAAGRVQAWRHGDGEAARPIFAPLPHPRDTALTGDFQLAA